MFNFRQLKAFDNVMRLGTVTAAAKALNVSQPSITRLIHELESTLGFSLFIRKGRGIISTIEARRFHQAVESAFINIEKLDELAASIRKKTVGKVSVGVIPTVSLTFCQKCWGKAARPRGKTILRCMSAIPRQSLMPFSCNNLILGLYHGRHPMKAFIFSIRHRSIMWP